MAAEGCKITSGPNTGVVYSVLLLVYNPLDGQLSYCPAGSTTGSTYRRSINRVPTEGCSVLLGGSIVATGVKVDYTVVQCPLDDYSWAFGASAAALGVFVIRKRKK